MLPGMIEHQVTGPGPAAGAKGAVRIEEPQRWEQAVVRRSAEARATVPDLELEIVAAMDRSLELARELGCPVSALVLRACALALREVPRANGAYREGKFELYSRINVGVVVASEETYAIPTVFDADQKSAPELAGEVERLGARARAGQLSPPELSGATFTFWAAGELGFSRATPLVVPPQAAAVAAGAVTEVPKICEERFMVGHSMMITLGCDHRILYGSHAGRFMDRIKTQLEEGKL